MKKNTPLPALNKTPAMSHEDKPSLRNRLLAENEFVCGLVSLMYIPQHKAQNEEDDDDEVMDVDEEERRKKFPGKTSRVKSVDELQERLQKKLAELKGNRDAGKKKKKNKLTKIERKQKAIEEKKLKKKLFTAGKVAQDITKADKKNKGGNKAKPVFNSEGKIVFSKFDFTEDGTSATAEKKQSLDPKSALQKIKKQKEKLKSLKAIGKTERVKNIEEKTAWNTAIEKAEGVKVKDDETLLKKSIKKLEQKKSSAKKKWDERNSQVTKKKDAKQHKRTENIQNRKEQVKKNKFKKAAKRGRVVPGFR